MQKQGLRAIVSNVGGHCYLLRFLAFNLLNGEMVKKEKYNHSVDIWSIGVLYFEMLYGEKPFGNQMSQMRILNEGIMLKANQVNFPSTPKCTVSNESK